MKNIVKKSKEFAAAAILVTLPFTVGAANDAPATDKIANSEKTASCVIDKFKSDIAVEFNRLSADNAPQTDKKVNMAQAMAAAMDKITSNTVDCVSEVTGIPKNQIPQPPNMEDFFTNPEQFEAQDLKFNAFMSTYMTQEAYQKAMEKGSETEIVPFLKNMIKGENKAAPAPTPKP